MSKRPTTPKMFLSYSSRTSKTAEGFLQAYEDFITTGELSAKTSPVLSQVNRRDISPEIGLTTIRNICSMHVLKLDELSVENALMNGGRTTKSDKPITATIYTVDGEVATHLVDGEQKPLISHHLHPQEGERWCWNKLNAGEHDWYAEVVCHKVIVIGHPMTIKITYEDALRALRKVTKVPYLHTNKVSAGKPKMKVRAKSQSFSHG